MEPLFFVPVYKKYLWGGDRIQEVFQRGEPSVAESWEIADREDGMSIVESGTFAGRSLSELTRRFGNELLGSGNAGNRFPLLVKLLDTQKKLSLQVHPDEEGAEQYGGEAKTEMWYVLGGTDDASISVGFRTETTPETFERSARRNELDDLLEKHRVREGDAFYVPGGTVHVIGAGCLLLEVQQNSNTTYRIWDWNRVDADGKPRELHWESAMQTIHWNGIASKLRPTLLSESDGIRSEQIVSSEYFHMERHLAERDIVFDTKEKSFDILFLKQGEAVIVCPVSGKSGGKNEFAFPMGRSCLIPAALKNYRLRPVSEPIEVLRVSGPR